MEIKLLDVYTDYGSLRLTYEKQLFGLLHEREPYQNISHKEMPSLEQHLEFVRSKPYDCWYVIYSEGDFVGSIYLGKESNIGLFIRKKYKGQGIGKQALRELIKLHPRDHYLANIAPNNQASFVFFLNMGFKYDSVLIEDNKLIQFTLKFTPASGDLYEQTLEKSHAEETA